MFLWLDNRTQTASRAQPPQLHAKPIQACFGGNRRRRQVRVDILVVVASVDHYAMPGVALASKYRVQRLPQASCDPLGGSGSARAGVGLNEAALLA